MSIKPFVDRPESDPGSSRKTQVASSDGIDTSQIDVFRAGINIRSMADFGRSMVPVITSRGIPKRQDERFDFTIEQNTFGQSKFFEDPGEDGKNIAFDDIGNYGDPVAYINSDYRYALYPEVLHSPNWIDPGLMDGVLEPLTIRSKINNTTNEGPFVSHDIRASMMPSTGHEILGRSSVVSNLIEFYPSSKIPPYFDSQDIAMTMEIDGVVLDLSAEGYAFPEPSPVKPFDDTVDLNVTDISRQAGLLSFKTAGLFTENPGYGIYGKSSPTGFNYRGGVYEYKDTSTGNKTGNQRVNGVDSIAFGGLLK